MPHSDRSIDRSAWLHGLERIRDVYKRQLVDFAIELGVEQAFIQEGDTAEESFIPPFTLEGV